MYLTKDWIWVSDKSRLGAMAAIVTKLGFIVYESAGNALPNGRDVLNDSGTDTAADSSDSLQSSFSGSYRHDVEDVEQKAYYTRSVLSWGWFIIFWMVSEQQTRLWVCLLSMSCRAVQPSSKQPRVGVMEQPCTFVGVSVFRRGSVTHAADRLCRI